MLNTLAKIFGFTLACAMSPAFAQSDPRPIALNEGFEQVDVPNSGIYANGWMRADASEPPLRGATRGHGWHQSNFPYFLAYDAPAASMVTPAGIDEIPETGTVSVWLLSPPIAFGPSFSLEFQARSFRSVIDATGVDRLQVRLCTGEDCTDVGDTAEDAGAFGQLLLDINAEEADSGFPDAWTAYQVNAGAGVPSSGVGRIAFRYFVHQTSEVRAAGLLGLDRVVVASAPTEGQGISLRLHASLYDGTTPPGCDGTNTLSATRGDWINLCYAVTNTSSETLTYHWLRDDLSGPLLAQDIEPLPPGATRQFHRLISVTHDEAITASATSDAQPQDYRLDDSLPPAYVDIHQTGTLVSAGAVQTAPFPFQFYGRNIARYCLRNDATLAVVNEGDCPQQTVDAIPTDDVAFVNDSPFAAVYAARFWPNYGQIFQQVLGAAPNRQWVIQWYQQVPIDIPPAAIDPNQGLDAELILHEGSNQIEFQYRNTRFGAATQLDDGGNASIGMQKDLLGLRYTYHEPALASVRRIAWTPTHPASRVDTQVLTVTALIPVLQTSPAVLSASAPSHGSASQTLWVTNSGTGRLDWSSSLADTGPRGVGGAPEQAFYTFDLWNSFQGTGFGQLIRFSPGHTNYEAPDGATVVANLDGRSILAAAFIDDDFTTFYGIDADTRELLRWIHVDQPYPAATYEVIGVVPLLLDAITGLRADPTTGTTYLTTSNGASSMLWRIDLATATVDAVGTVDGAVAIDDIAFDSQGRLYGVDESLNALVQIDKSSGQAQPIVDLGIDASNGSALDFDPATATLYLITFDQNGGSLYNELFSIDVANGTVNALSEVVGLDPALPIALWETLGIAHRTSTCTAPSDVPWITVIPADGSVDAGAPAQGIAVSFDGSSLPDGVYDVNLCLHSNDPLHSRIAVPLHFELGAEAIFDNGFES